VRACGTTKARVALDTVGTNISLKIDRVNFIMGAKVGSADGKAQADIPASMGGTAPRRFPGILTTTPTVAAANLGSAAEDSVIMNSAVLARRGTVPAEAAALMTVAKARCGKAASIDLIVAEARNVAGRAAGANVNKSRVGLAALMVRATKSVAGRVAGANVSKSRVGLTALTVRAGNSVAGRAAGAGVNKSAAGSKDLTTMVGAMNGNVAAKMNADTSDGFKAIAPKAAAKCTVAVVFTGTAKVGRVAKSRMKRALQVNCCFA
jgi:hypothetical protein